MRKIVVMAIVLVLIMFGLAFAIGFIYGSSKATKSCASLLESKEIFAVLCQPSITSLEQELKLCFVAQDTITAHYELLDMFNEE